MNGDDPPEADNLSRIRNSFSRWIGRTRWTHGWIVLLSLQCIQNIFTRISVDLNLGSRIYKNIYKASRSLYFKFCIWKTALNKGSENVPTEITSSRTDWRHLRVFTCIRAQCNLILSEAVKPANLLTNTKPYFIQLHFISSYVHSSV